MRLNLLQINLSDLSIITIENLSKLLKSRALGFDVEEEDEEEFEEDPDLSELANESKNLRHLLLTE